MIKVTPHFINFDPRCNVPLDQLQSPTTETQLAPCWSMTFATGQALSTFQPG